MGTRGPKELCISCFSSFPTLFHPFSNISKQSGWDLTFWMLRPRSTRRPGASHITGTFNLRTSTKKQSTSVTQIPPMNSANVYFSSTIAGSSNSLHKTTNIALENEGSSWVKCKIFGNMFFIKVAAEAPDTNGTWMTTFLAQHSQPSRRSCTLADQRVEYTCCESWRPSLQAICAVRCAGTTTKPLMSGQKRFRVPWFHDDLVTCHSSYWYFWKVVRF